MPCFTYMLASRSHNALYVGSARDHRRRVAQHRAGAVEAHTAKYRIHKLVWFETHDTLEAALIRERRIKRWRRKWKEELIASVNPGWRDLAVEIPY